MLHTRQPFVWEMAYSKKVCCTLADQPLQLIIQRIRTGLHGIECSCIVQQRALFCGQRVTLGQMVGNNPSECLRGSLGLISLIIAIIKQAPFQAVQFVLVYSTQGVFSSTPCSKVSTVFKSR